MADELPDPLEFTFQARWVGLDETPVIFVNQMLGQVDYGEVFVTFGQVTPPALLGTPEQQLQQAQDVPLVPIRTVARLSMTPDRLRQLIDILNTTLSNAEREQAFRASKDKSK